MFSDPLILAFVSMIVGMLFGALASVLAIMISQDLHEDQHLTEMYDYYDTIYNKEDK